MLDKNLIKSLDASYAAWADRQVKQYQDRFDARVREYMSNPDSDISPAAVLKLAETV